MKYLGIVLLFLSGYVMAEEEVYYCVPTEITGFSFNEKTGIKHSSSFGYSRKVMIKLQDDGNIKAMHSGLEFQYICSSPVVGMIGLFKVGSIEDMKTCVSDFHEGSSFNFNPENGRYVRTEGSAYVFHNGGLSIEYGTCTKF